MLDQWSSWLVAAGRALSETRSCDSRMRSVLPMVTVWSLGRARHAGGTVGQSEDSAVVPSVHGVVVTYRRPTDLARMLASLTAQTVRLRSVVVVDNGLEDEARAVVEQASAGLPLDYLPTGANLGPAGGLARGVERVLAEASDDDWILFLDDDNPQEDPQVVEGLLALALDCSTVDARTGAVGLVGSRLDRRRGRLLRPPDAALHGTLSVDYIGGDSFPLYSAGVLRQVGGPRSELFFGFDDLELGLQLGRAGHTLYADGDAWRRLRDRYGRLGKVPRRSPRVTWRDYYSVRNLILILRGMGLRRAAVRVTLRAGLARGLVRAATERGSPGRVLGLHLRACVDGWTGRTGRRVDPDRW